MLAVPWAEQCGGSITALSAHHPYSAIARGLGSARKRPLSSLVDDMVSSGCDCQLASEVLRV
jgi:hypothetical protein